MLEHQHIAVNFFMAFSVKDKKLELLDTELHPPGDELFRFIRTFGAGAGIGRYRHFDHDIESRTHGFHLFEHGVVKLKTVVLDK